MFFLLVFTILLQNSIQEPINANPSEIVSEVDVVEVPSTRSLKEIEHSDDVEIQQLANLNPLIRYLVSPNSRSVQSNDDSMKKNFLPHNDFVLFRTRRNASPTYKKSYPSSGGGCCSSCGQCGGGCGGGGCGGGQSGSYSQSSSYSSSSSGSYNSYGKKK